jgi:hypothetical protein
MIMPDKNIKGPAATAIRRGVNVSENGRSSGLYLFGENHENLLFFFPPCTHRGITLPKGNLYISILFKIVVTVGKHIPQGDTGRGERE